MTCNSKYDPVTLNMTLSQRVLVSVTLTLWVVAGDCLHAKTIRQLKSLDVLSPSARTEMLKRLWWTWHSAFPYRKWGESTKGIFKKAFNHLLVLLFSTSQSSAGSQEEKANGIISLWIFESLAPWAVERLSLTTSVTPHYCPGSVLWERIWKLRNLPLIQY